MAYATDRVQLFDRDMNPLRELAPNEVFSRKRTEEVNGEHELVITTTRKLEEGWRALTVDGTGKWREWVVTEIDEDHSSGKTAMGTYRFVWSLQYDLTYSYAHTHAEIGYGDSPKTAIQVAGVVLEGVPDWTVGDCDAANVPAGTGAVMIYESAWSRLSKAVECLGCEVEADIEVSNLYGVTARKLCLMAHVGNEVATRRFDWGHDLTDIKRTPDPGPYYCRVVPLGKGEQEYAEDDETTFDWPMDITDETGDPNLYYIEDSEATQAFRVKKSDGSYYYPTIAVKYDEDDPELLLNAAQDDLHNHTRPGVTYEASVAQFSQAGMDTHGVALGDEVQCVDSGFNEDAPLRIQGRVIKMEVDELSPDTTTQLTIGQLRNDLTSAVATMGRSFDELTSRSSDISKRIAHMNTTRYVDELMERINAEINATGGYAYFVPGEGIITYDTAVSDPLVGAEATKVVQIKGGSIRIADSKKSGFVDIDDWNWKTVFESGHILAELVTAAQITTGFIGSTGGTFIDLDNNTVQLGESDSNHIVITDDYLRLMYDAIMLAHFGRSEYSIAGDAYSGVYYSLGNRLEPTPGIYSFTAGRDNHAGVSSDYAAAIGKGLYAPGHLDVNRPGGLAIGRYNTMYASGVYNGSYAGSALLPQYGLDYNGASLLFVVGNGTSDNNRSNALELDYNGNLALAGNLYASNIGVYKTSGRQSISNASINNKNTVATVLIDGSVGYNHDVWIVEATVTIYGSSKQTVTIGTGITDDYFNDYTSERSTGNGTHHLTTIIKGLMHASGTRYIGLQVTPEEMSTGSTTISISGVLEAVRLR